MSLQVNNPKLESYFSTELCSQQEYMGRILLAIENYDINKCDSDLNSALDSLVSNMRQFLVEHFNLKLISNPIKNYFDEYIRLSEFSAELLKNRSAKDDQVHYFVDYINMINRFAFQFHSSIIAIAGEGIGLPELDFFRKKKDNISSGFSSLTQIDGKGSPAIHPLDKKRDQSYKASIRAAKKLMDEQDYISALGLLKIAAKWKRDPDLLLVKAHCLLKLGQNEKAISHIIESIKKDPENSSAYNKLGMVVLSEGKATEAIKWFKKAKATQRNMNEYPYINSARAYMKLGDYPAALMELNEASKIAPDNKEILEGMSKIKEMINSKSRSDIEKTIH